jgi:hypothetical protein
VGGAVVVEAEEVPKVLSVRSWGAYSSFAGVKFMPADPVEAGLPRSRSRASSTSCGSLGRRGQGPPKVFLFRAPSVRHFPSEAYRSP